MQILKKDKIKEVLILAKWVKNWTSNREDAGSISGLTQWVKVLAAPIQCCCGVGRQLQM